MDKLQTTKLLKMRLAQGLALIGKTNRAWWTQD